MISTYIFYPADFCIRIISAKTAAPFDHIQEAIRPNRRIDEADELKTRQERINFQNAAVIIDLNLLNKVAGPFPDKKALIEIRGQLFFAQSICLEIINRTAHRRAP